MLVYVLALVVGLAGWPFISRAFFSQKYTGKMTLSGVWAILCLSLVGVCQCITGVWVK